MAFVRVGNILLDSGRVKVARIETDATPELRLMLQAPDETVKVPADTPAEASAWLDELGAHTGHRRIGPALLPLRRVRMAQALPALRIRIKGQLQDRGPGLRLTLHQEQVDIPTATLDEAQACLDELLVALVPDSETATADAEPGNTATGREGDELPA